MAMAVLQEGAFGGATLSLLRNSKDWRDHPPDDGPLVPAVAAAG